MGFDGVVEWYDGSRRDLPWRAPGVTPWGVLVSEVMLQQTPVARVEPAWREWMVTWPEPADLAAAPTADVLRAWGRLGYPRRALRLQECARALVERHSGLVPGALEDLLALPGVGAYTARAVLAFAFGERQPVIDTNVARVLARAQAGKPLASKAVSAADLRALEEQLPAEAAAAARLSIALMELGAVVCRADRPACALCPLEATCAWVASGRPAYDGPPRKAQGFAGTDRQVRGRIMALLRESEGPADVTAAWHLDEQRERALAGLVADGLVVAAGPGLHSLP